MTKLLILDMDGTIRVNGSADFDNLELTSGFINSPKDQKLIPSAIAAIKEFKSKGFTIIGASNQGGVAAGKKSLEDCHLEQGYTLKLLNEEEADIDRIYFCPDYEGAKIHEVYGFVDDRFGDFDFCYYEVDNSTADKYRGLYRKPNAGMLNYAIDLWNPTGIIFVGDRDSDEQAAKAANVQFIHAHEWRSSYWIA